MISSAEVQASIISELKADATLVALVDEEIREEQWMGTDYDYPCVRSTITRLAPIGIDGNCEDTRYECDFQLTFRHQGPSSKPCADGMRATIEAIRNKSLAYAGVFVHETRVKLDTTAGPIGEAIDLWLATTFFHCKLKEIVP